MTTDTKTVATVAVVSLKVKSLVAFAALEGNTRRTSNDLVVNPTCGGFQAILALIVAAGTVNKDLPVGTNIKDRLIAALTVGGTGNTVSFR